MNYSPNATQWKRGDVVIHDADAKEPTMLMRVTGFTRDGRVKTQYVDKRHKRTVWDNPMTSLHDPQRFRLYAQWGTYTQTRLEEVQYQWERARRWNHGHAIGVKVRTTSADGGFEAITISKAEVWNTGDAMVQLAPGGFWLLKFVECVMDEKSAHADESQGQR